MKVVMVKGPRQNLIKPKVVRSKERGSKQPGMILYRKIPDLLQVMRAFRTFGTINSNASGYVNIVSLLSSGVSTNPEWFNFSQEWQQYRIRRMLLKLFPCYTVAAAATGANDYPIGVVLCAPFWESVPAATSSLRQVPRLGLYESDKKHVMENNFLGFNQAQLWTATGMTVPSDAIYGFTLSSDTSMTALEPSNNVFNYVLEFDVEFQGVQ